MSTVTDDNLSRTESLRAQHGTKAPFVALAGGVLLLLSGLLSWSYDDRILGDLRDQLGEPQPVA